MTCHCGSIALRHVGSQGFCKEHMAEAFAEAAKAKRLQQSIAGLLALDHERRKSDEHALASRAHRA